MRDMLAQYHGHALQGEDRTPVAPVHLAVQFFFFLYFFYYSSIYVYILIMLVDFHFILKVKPKLITHK